MTARTMQLQKPLFTGIVASVIACALVGFVIVLRGQFGNLDARVLASALSIGVFSSLGLAYVRLLTSKYPTYQSFSVLGLLVAALGVLSFLKLIWLPGADHNLWQMPSILTILSVSGAQIAMLLPYRKARGQTASLLACTLLAIAIVTTMVVYLVADSSAVDELYFRLLSAVFIVDVVGTILTPIAAHSKPKPKPRTRRKK